MMLSKSNYWHQVVRRPALRPIFQLLGEIVIRAVRKIDGFP